MRSEIVPTAGGPIDVDSRSERLQPSGLSFCIITDGRRRRKLRREIDSIRRLGLTDYEILVGGIVPTCLARRFPDLRTVALREEALQGRLGAMRNRLAERARYDRLVICDDDLVFHRGFREGLREFGEDYDVLSVRTLNPDGSRYWDWCVSGGPEGHRLLDYEETSDHLYIGGCFCLIKAHVLDRVRWSEELRFYQGEDVDFSARLKAANFSMRFCPHITVTHADFRYRQRGDRVTRMPRAKALRHLFRRRWARWRGRD
jgi:GT2 family glycosyltransferase